MVGRWRSRSGRSRPRRARDSRAAVRARVGGLSGHFWVIWSGTLINRTATFVRPFLVLYLTGAEHRSLTTAGAVVSVAGFGSLVSQPVGGFLADRYGRRWTLAGGMIGHGRRRAAARLRAHPRVHLRRGRPARHPPRPLPPGRPGDGGRPGPSRGPAARLRAALLGHQPRLLDRHGGRRGARPARLHLALLGRRPDLRLLRAAGAPRRPGDPASLTAPRPPGDRSGCCCATG